MKVRHLLRKFSNTSTNRFFIIMNTASICTIGDEILIGQIVDTNSSEIAKSLNLLGIKVTDMKSFGDDHDTIIRTLDNELKSHDIVITTGGLGPTKDDITKKVLSELSRKLHSRNCPAARIMSPTRSRMKLCARYCSPED